MEFEEIREKCDRFIMPTYARFDLALVSGTGATAQDVNGKRYIDFTSGIGVNALGWCDSAWTQAVATQAATLQHTSNLYYTPVQAELAERLCGLSGMAKVFFCNSGAEANECAIKLARKYGTEQLGAGKTGIVTLKNSFHGRTVTTLAATGQDEFHTSFLPLTGGFGYAEPTMESVRDNVDASTCAVLVELIQGEGGVVPLDAAFVKALRDFCTERKILLIVDEVQTGVGRTGEFYSYQKFGIMPDIVSSAKGLAGGLPIGACLCSDELGTILGPGTHGSTFGGNPVVCAGALAVLDRVGTSEFMAGVEKKGAYLSSRLATLPEITAVRGRGLMIGAKSEVGTPGEIAAACVESGLLILTAKEMLRCLPPLVITEEEIDAGLDILSEVLKSFH